MFKSSKILVFIVFFLLLAACNEKAADEYEESVFKKSYLSLMPEGTPDELSFFSPLHPSVVSWGADPIYNEMDEEIFSKSISTYKEIGISLIASNVWMLTATERYMYEYPEFQKAVCVDIEGEPIVPGWLDSEYKGVRPWWGCTNHPLYRSLIRERASLGIRAGANMLHIDDHMGTCAAASHSGGCFCSYCMNGFKEWLCKEYSVDSLFAMGIVSPDSFNYSSFIKKAGFQTRSSYISGVYQGSIPLHHEFMSFQRNAAAEFIRELGELADSIAGKKIPVGVNSWNLDPLQLATSHYADYFSNEVQHYNKEDLIPPFVYLLGNALNKPVFSTGTGEDWIKIKYKESPERIKRWIASAYSFGNYFMYSYNKWGYSEERGTQWYQIPMETFETYFSFIRNNQSLFDGFTALKQVGVFYDNAAFGNGNTSSRTICRKLHYANIPTALIVSGDENLKYELIETDLNPFEYLVLPENTKLSEEMKVLFQPFSSKNKLIHWKEGLDIASVIPSKLSISGGKNVWAIPRINITNAQHHILAVHLLNQDFDEEKDKMNKKTDIEVSINMSLFNKINSLSAMYYMPGADPVQLDIHVQNKGITVLIPRLDIWGILKIE